MKKRFIAVVSLLVLSFTLTACGKFTCDLCGKEKSGKKHTEKTLIGEVTVCDDCYKDLKDFASGFGF